MFVRPNIHTELILEQAGLVIHAIDQLLAGPNTGGLSEQEVENLARVAHNLEIHSELGAG